MLRVLGGLRGESGVLTKESILVDQLSHAPAPTVHADYFGLTIGKAADGRLTYADDLKIETFE